MSTTRALPLFAGWLPSVVAVDCDGTLVDGERCFGPSRPSGTFDVVVTAEDVAGPEPAPDPYLLARTGLGTHPADTPAVEDYAVGSSSARSAGLPTVAVLQPARRGRRRRVVVTSPLAPRSPAGPAVGPCRGQFHENCVTDRVAARFPDKCGGPARGADGRVRRTPLSSSQPGL